MSLQCSELVNKSIAAYSAINNNYILMNHYGY